MGKVKFKIVLLLLVTVIGGLYAEEEVFTESDFEYTVENGKASITDYTGSASNLIIPKKLGGFEVTSVGDHAFYGCKSLTTLEIPDSVTSIEDFAFSMCSSLTTLEIPDSVISIGDHAFWNCWSLATLEIPDSVTSIGDHAFASCESLTTLEIPDSVTSIGDGAFVDCESLTAIRLSKNNPVYSFSEGVLFNKKQKSLHTYLMSKKETSYALPDSVTSIRSYAFALCYSLNTLKIPDSVTSIGKQAFEGGYSLTTIEIPDSTTSIGQGAFLWCDNLTLAIENEGSYAHKYALENGVDFVLD